MIYSYLIAYEALVRRTFSEVVVRGNYHAVLENPLQSWDQIQDIQKRICDERGYILTNIFNYQLIRTDSENPVVYPPTFTDYAKVRGQHRLTDRDGNVHISKDGIVWELSPRLSKKSIKKRKGI